MPAVPPFPTLALVFAIHARNLLNLGHGSPYFEVDNFSKITMPSHVARFLQDPSHRSIHRTGSDA